MKRIRGILYFFPTNIAFLLKDAPDFSSAAFTEIGFIHVKLLGSSKDDVLWTRPIETNAEPVDCPNASSQLWIRMVSFCFLFVLWQNDKSTTFLYFSYGGPNQDILVCSHTSNLISIFRGNLWFLCFIKGLVTNYVWVFFFRKLLYINKYFCFVTNNLYVHK